MKKLIFCCFISTIFFYGCADEESIIPSTSKEYKGIKIEELNFLAYFNTPNIGFIEIKEEHPWGNDSSASLDEEINAIFYDSSRINKAFFSHLNLNGTFLIPNNSGEYFSKSTQLTTSIYGDTIRVQLIDSLNNQYIIDTAIYTAENIYVTDNISVQFLDASTFFEWNKDSLNNSKVGVSLNYDPKHIDNLSLYNQGYTKEITNGIVLEDNGGDFLKRELYYGVPKYATVKITFFRGSYYKLPATYKNKFYSFFVISSTSKQFVSRL